MPCGSGTPRASRYRAASSTAMNRGSPAMRTDDDAPGAFEVADARGDPRLERSRARFLRAVRSPSASSRSWTAVRRSRAVARVEALQLPLDVVDRVGIEQLAQLRIAEQLAQLRLIDRQRLRAPLGERRVAVVHEACDVAEEQRCRERRRLVGIHGRRRGSCGCRDVARASRPAPACRRSRAGTRDTSRASSGNDPKRDATASRSAARLRCCQSGARMPGRRFGSSSDRAAFSRNFAANSAVRAELPHDERLHFVGIGQQQRADRAARPTPETARRTHRRPTAFRRRRRSPRGSSPRRPSPTARECGRRAAKHADAPVAELVAHALDDDRALRRAARASRRSDRADTAAGSRRRARRDRVRASAVRWPPPAAAAADRASARRCEAELERPAGAVALPERHLARLARRGRDEHAIVRDLLDRATTRRRARTSRRRGSRTPSPRRARRRARRRVRAPTRKTPYSPRSGIVPPLAIATRLAPSRAAIVPATRSHVMRGRSSANSSDG